MSEITLRPAAAIDGTFLADMLVDAANWHPSHRRPRHEVLAHPAYRRYVVGWMRPGDAGVIATLPSGEPIGAGWVRPGPGGRAELMIGVRAPYRAQGVERDLLREVCTTAQAAGHVRVSMHVHEDNPAVALYRSAGFRWQSNDDGRDLMTRSLI